MKIARNILIGLVAFIVGAVSFAYSEMHFHDLIRDLYSFFTANAITFKVPKLYLAVCSPRSLYFLLSVFGISFVVLSLSNLKQKLSTIGKSLTVYIVLFEVSLLTICFFAANLRLLECTTCDGGELLLSYSEVKYGLILGTSTLIAIIPSVIRWIKS